jgi:hypothetical protein
MKLKICCKLEKRVNLKDLTMEEKDRWEGERWLHSQNLLEEGGRRKKESIRERILENVCHSFLMPFCSNDQGIKRQTSLPSYCQRDTPHLAILPISSYDNTPSMTITLSSR